MGKMKNRKPPMIEFGRRAFLRRGLAMAGISQCAADRWRWLSSARGDVAGEQPVQGVVEYLKSISGKRIVAGIHNREPNRNPARQTDRVFSITGKYPGLWSGDFLYSADDIASRWTMIRECRKQWEAGSMVQLMFHVAPPNQPQACAWQGGILSHLSDEQWDDLISDGGKLNKAWKSRLDEYATYLEYLKTGGVRVLVRPHHEMNTHHFWWSGRPGPRGTGALYRLTHDYLTKEKGLSNLIWVWDMQDDSRDFADYNPGGDYWDIFAFDIYGKGYDKSWYDYVVSIVGDKPMGIGECGKLPTAAVLAAQPRWCFFMSWAELTFQQNSKEQIAALYRLPNVVTREELPRLK
jgi:hypothetical protein